MRKTHSFFHAVSMTLYYTSRLYDSVNTGEKPPWVFIGIFSFPFSFSLSPFHRWFLLSHFFFASSYFFFLELFLYSSIRLFATEFSFSVIPRFNRSLATTLTTTTSHSPTFSISHNRLIQNSHILVYYNSTISRSFILAPFFHYKIEKHTNL